MKSVLHFQYKWIQDFYWIYDSKVNIKKNYLREINGLHIVHMCASFQT